jgi:DNA-binding NarL/FixJ family response regulator
MRRRPIGAGHDRVVRSMLRMNLADAFEVVVAAADSEAAIEPAKSSQPDAALVDIGLPKAGGLRAVLGILKVAPQTAVVLPSAGDSDTTVAELMRLVRPRRKGIAYRLSPTWLSAR